MSRTPQHWTIERAAGHIAVPGPESDKYRRGVLGVRTGTTAYPGAAVLGVEAAWRTGVGMVRYVSALGEEPPGPGLPSPAAAVLARRPETVLLDGSAALHVHSDAWLIGSGTDPSRRGFAEREALLAILAGDAPVVVDAGALPELTMHSGAGSEAAAHGLASRRAPTVVTPHSGEFLRLWAAVGLGVRPPGWPERDAGPSDRGPQPETKALVDAASELAAALGATVLLKGSLSVVATPGGFRAIAGPATPWLATAGTGDVLAGILGALTATHAAPVRSDPEMLGPLAASAAVLHDAAARTAARGGRAPITALDVAEALPATLAELLR